MVKFTSGSFTESSVIAREYIMETIQVASVRGWMPE